MKLNKQQIILIWIIILAIVWYVFFWMNKKTDTVKPTTSTWTTSTNSWKTTIVIPESEQKWTQFLLKELKEKMLSINPDLVIESAKSSWNYAYIKFKCSITTDSVQRLLSTTKDKNWNAIDIKSISAEQVSLLKKNMETDCNTMNSVSISKWMVFVVNTEALSYKQITPSVYFDKLINILPVDFANWAYWKKLQVISSIFSYEDNINQILNDKEKLFLIKKAYNEIKWNIISLKISDPEVAKLLWELDILIDYYTK